MLSFARKFFSVLGMGVGIKLSSVHTIRASTALLKPMAPMTKLVLPGPLTTELRTSCQSEVVASCAPIHFSDNRFNEFNSLRNRVTAPTPRVSKRVVAAYAKWAIRDFDLLFRGWDRNMRYPGYEQAINECNATPSMKADYFRVAQEMELAGISPASKCSAEQLRKWTKRKSFLKVENLLWRTPSGLREKSPRTIMSSDAHMTVLTLGWFRAASSQLSSLWTPSKSLCYAGGLSGEQAGSFFKRFGSRASCVEDDVSQWDASLGKELLDVEVSLAQRMGAPVAVVQMMQAARSVRGRSRWGIKFKARPMRSSGCTWTSFFNSVTNALIHLFSFIADKHGLNFDREATKEGLRDCAQIVMGDDNALFCKRKVDFAKWMSRFGFRSETLHRKNVWETGFCSSRPLPFAGGEVKLIPNPVVVACKFGTYCTNKTVPIADLKATSAKGLYNSLSFLPCVKRIFDKAISAGVVIEGALARRILRSEYQPWCSRPSIPTPLTLALLKEWIWCLDFLGSDDFPVPILAERVSLGPSSIPKI